ncbi:MAG: dihydroneopterin aldolase [Helicobacter sp.]|nr:dihydroneopterin aldolase [Helicobacter sp.]
MARYSISLKNLILDARVGILESEKNAQKIEINLSCAYEIYEAKDDVFLDYTKLISEIKRVVKSSHFGLLEQLCDALIEALKIFNNENLSIKEASVEITKLELFKICDIDKGAKISVQKSSIF